MRAYGNRALVLLVRVTSHQGRREGRLQGEAAQGDGNAGGRARDVRILSWRIADSGEPRDTETVPRGSGRGGEKRSNHGTSLAAYFILCVRNPRSTLSAGKPRTWGRGNARKSARGYPLTKVSRVGVTEFSVERGA